MIPSNAGVCFLTGIGGHFLGNQEVVEIIRGDHNSNDPQLLTGSSNQDHVHAEAHCLRYSI
jgi:hypothetical protein